MKETYVDENGPSKGILVPDAFSLCYMPNRPKGKIPGRLFFGQDMTITTKHIAYWKLIYQWNQAHINDGNSCENENRITHNHKEGDMVMVRNNLAYKYETPYKVLHEKSQIWTNVTVTL